MNTKSELPFLQVSGTYFEIGHQIGTHFRQAIQKTFSTDSRIKQLLHWDEIQPHRVTEAEKLTRIHFPQYLDEIRGMAEGADLPYRDVLTVNFMHLPPVVNDDCSTVILCEGDHIILAHNEDHEIGLGKAAYLVQCNYTASKVSLFSFLYPGCIPGLSFGFNSHGVVVACNYAPDPNIEIGIPRLMHGHWVLEAPTLAEAIARAQAYPPRAGGVTYNIVSMTDKAAVVLETTGKLGDVHPVKDRFFHTNHYLAQQFSHIPIPARSKSSTVKRYTRGIELLQNAQKTGKGALSLMQDPSIFLEPFTFPSGATFYSICTAIFEIETGTGIKSEIESGIESETESGIGISLKIYGRGHYRDIPFSISLGDLQNDTQP
ncbi:MAG: C45 family autoproteolytic acyltransferase/hydrolase [Promethearchaeota archaeon]